MTRRRETPLGVKLICAFGALDAGLSILRALGGIALSVFGSPLGGVFALVSLAIGLGQLATMWGLWKMESWAWSLAMVALAVGAVFDLLGLLTGSGGLVSLVLSTGLTLYLSSKRDLFRRH